MQVTSLGDMAQSFQLRLHNNTVKTDVQRLTKELSSGQTSDIGKTVRGDFSLLAGVERGLRLSEIYATSIAEADLYTGAQQAALGTIQDKLTDLAPLLFSATGAGEFATLFGAAADAESALDLAVSALNTQIAGRSLFAGDKPDQPALISAEAILDELTPIAAAASTASEMVSLITDWFLQAGGGYETLAFTGGDGATPSYLIGEGETVAAGSTANDQGVREALLGFSIAALASRQTGPSDTASLQSLLEAAGTRMLSAQDSFSSMRADLGIVQGRIEESRVRNEAMAASLTLEQGRILGIDPYETATELEATSLRLETLFLLTSRLSRLSLAEYLR